MSESAVKPKLASVPDPEGKDGDGGQLAGRVLDWTAVAAGVVLAVIVVDIISGGKLSRWMLQRRKGCQDCGEDQEAGGDDS